ncbi:hypothetical protein N7466_000154 [Penicillium verhagenii]|uniref:uncharacterized protein n=1 Tax=Penicillium verhagenii TaxID=1562060 RepID=UPI0025453922|nr:uncharacterized protein N7466_000154 [Penicillium verhagenii]KAJ5947139.1 hypothetical protein N7466_000154 [Penicillium verhagenii]
MSFTLASRSIASRLFQNFAPTSLVALRTLSPKQKNWHLNLPPQRYCSSTPPANPLQKPTNPPNQFPLTESRSGDIWEADQIEIWRLADGYRVWGFPIYRSTYQSDAEWDEFMRRLVADTTESLCPDLFDNMALTVFDDPTKFDGATTAVIRDHFKQWVVTAEQEERSPEFDPERIKIDVYGAQRYRYCIQVTQEMLESVIADEGEAMAIVRIIRGDWEEYSPYKDDFRFEEEREAIEGCTLEDVGWINVPFDGVMTICWGDLRGDWDGEYRRPPSISCHPWFDVDN